MKIIFSRKGFDSAAGGVPSPIFPSGEMYSLPIPDELSPKRYREIRIGGHNLGAVVHDLSRGEIKPARRAHLDPDLNSQSLERNAGWRPLFGQASAAERHLRNKRVGAGDVFLFFGWFREVTRSTTGKYSYVRGASDQHVIFGWLQIEQRVCSESMYALPPWAADHPHYDGNHKYLLNTLYVSKEKLEWPKVATDKPGAGAFCQYSSALRLSAAGQSRSLWHLPTWFNPNGKNSCLSYHSNLNRWSTHDDHVRLRTAPRGQEFVLDCDDYPEAIPWLAEIIESCK